RWMKYFCPQLRDRLLGRQSVAGNLRRGRFRARFAEESSEAILGIELQSQTPASAKHLPPAQPHLLRRLYDWSTCHGDNRDCPWRGGHRESVNRYGYIQPRRPAAGHLYPSRRKLPLPRGTTPGAFVCHRQTTNTASPCGSFEV